jgi:hypothetical protein
MAAGPRLAFAAAIAMLAAGSANAAPPQTSPWGAPQPVQQTPPLNACQHAPTQPPYPYDKNVCCRQPDVWQQQCTDEAATRPTNTMPGAVVCISTVYVCTARPPRRP